MPLPEHCSISTDLWQQIAEGTVQHGVGNVVEGRGLGVEDDDAGAGGLRGRNQTGDRIDLKARTNREQKVGLLSCRNRAVDDLGRQRLSERDRIALQNSVAFAAWRILFTGANPLERLF